MPRNGSGTMTAAQTYSTGQTITAAVINANITDIAAELTNSVAKDGQTVMTGQFKAATGTAAAPSITFGADLDTGFYRKSGNEIGIAVGGVELEQMATHAMAVARTQGANRNHGRTARGDEAG